MQLFSRLWFLKGILTTLISAPLLTNIINHTYQIDNQNLDKPQTKTLTINSTNQNHYQNISINKKQFNLPNNYKSFTIQEWKLDLKIKYKTWKLWQSDQTKKITVKLNAKEMNTLTQFINNNELKIILESQINFTSLNVKVNTTSFLGILYDKNIAQGVTWHQIENWQLNVDYQYYVIDEEEKNLVNFLDKYFQTPKDLNIHNLNDGHDLLANLLIDLKADLFFPHKKLEVDLFYGDYNSPSLFYKPISIAIKVNGQLLRNKNGQHFFTLSLINVKTYAPLIKKIHDFFNHHAWNFTVPSKYQNLSDEKRKVMTNEIMREIFCQFFPNYETIEIQNIVRNFVFEPKKWKFNHELRIDVSLFDDDLFLNTLTLTDFFD